MKLHTCVDYRHCIIITFLTKAVFFPVVLYARNPGRVARQCHFNKFLRSNHMSLQARLYTIT